jgi:phospholipid transport system transporter-binding protein
VNTVNLTAKDSILFINGELTRHSLALINKNNYSSCFKFTNVTVNLSEVSKVDTAGLAWLFCFLEQAIACSCEVNFIHLPEKLYKLIELSGVNGLLPITVSE